LGIWPFIDYQFLVALFGWLKQKSVIMLGVLETIYRFRFAAYIPVPWYEFVSKGVKNQKVDVIGSMKS
jgi:hypothetical protein